MNEEYPERSGDLHAVLAQHVEAVGHSRRMATERVSVLSRGRSVTCSPLPPIMIGGRGSCTGNASLHAFCTLNC